MVLKLKEDEVDAEIQLRMITNQPSYRQDPCYMGMLNVEIIVITNAWNLT